MVVEEDVKESKPRNDFQTTQEGRPKKYTKKRHDGEEFERKDLHENSPPREEKAVKKKSKKKKEGVPEVVASKPSEWGEKTDVKDMWADGNMF